jgi:hypothetical protein
MNLHAMTAQHTLLKVIQKYFILHEGLLKHQYLIFRLFILSFSVLHFSCHKNVSSGSGCPMATNS